MSELWKRETSTAPAFRFKPLGAGIEFIGPLEKLPLLRLVMHPVSQSSALLSARPHVFERIVGDKVVYPRSEVRMADHDITL